MLLLSSSVHIEQLHGNRSIVRNTRGEGDFAESRAPIQGTSSVLGNIGSVAIAKTQSFAQLHG